MTIKDSDHKRVVENLKATLYEEKQEVKEYENSCSERQVLDAETILNIKQMKMQMDAWNRFWAHENSSSRARSREISQEPPEDEEEEDQEDGAKGEDGGEIQPLDSISQQQPKSAPDREPEKVKNAEELKITTMLTAPAKRGGTILT